MRVYRIGGLIMALCFTWLASGRADDKALPPNPAGEVKAKDNEKPECKIRMEFGRREFQDVEVKKKKILGAQFNLTREGNVLFGFVLSKATRLKINKDSITGSFAEMDISLSIKEEGPRTKIFGLLNEHRLTIVLSDSKVEVNTFNSHLGLGLSRGNRLKGQIGSGANISGASLVTFGCDLEYIRERPGLALVIFLWWLVE